MNFKGRRFEEIRDAISGAGLTAFGAAYLYFVSDIKQFMPGLTFGGSRLFPIVTGIGMVVLGLFICLKTLRQLAVRPPAEKASPPPAVKKSGAWGIALTFVFFLAYSCVLQPLGFLLATFAYLFAMIMLLTPKGRRKPLRFLVVALVADVAVYLLFTRVFELVLPLGIVII